MFRSSGSDRFEQKNNSKNGCCCIEKYEEQITILQEKLMEIHNKLIEQLDVCQQQELLIIQLNKKIMNLQSQSNQHLDQSASFASSCNNADISKDLQDYSKDSFCPDKNIEFTLNNSKQVLQIVNYSSPAYSQSNRNELLKTDLQAMRLKLLEQMGQKASIREELEKLRITHNEKINQYKKNIKNLQHDHQFLLKQYDYIKINLEKGNLKKSQKNQINQHLNQLNEKCNEFQRLYKKQVNLNQELNQKILELKSVISSQKDKIKTIEIELDKDNHCIKSTSTAADGLRDEKERQQLCGTIRISKNPRNLLQKDTNKDKTPQKVSESSIFKIRNFYADINYLNDQKMIEKIKQTKENIVHDSASSIKSVNKEKLTKSKSKQDYESTRELIRKLQQAEMLTRQRRKTNFI